VTDVYYYSAFGEEIAKSGTTENEFRYVGEQWDPNAGFYYLRARWMDPSTGRFVSVDPYAGDPQAPVSLHRYLYANGSPASMMDPSGNFTCLEVMSTISITGILVSLTPVYVSATAALLQKFSGGEKPDADGYIDMFEAVRWWKYGKGQPLTVDLGKMNLMSITTADFINQRGILDSTKTFNLDLPPYFELNNYNEAFVYGSITLTLTGPNTVSSTFDVYDFDPLPPNGTMKRDIRNWLTAVGGWAHGGGESFRINIKGVGQIE
jgi:RHS repeat-associated protein